MKSMVTCSFLLKKPFPIVLLAIFCLSQGISQERKRITNQDKNGTIILEGEIDIYDDKVDTVWVRRFDSNGTKIEEKKFKNGELNGAWKGWYSNRSKKYRIRYKNGVIHGTSEHFDSTGLTIVKKKYKNGTLHGKQKEWYPNGELLKVVVYELGMINGVYNEWWDNGAKKVEGQYAGNKKKGVWMNYDPGRRSRYDFYRSDGLLVSYDFEYYANGQIKEEPSFNKDGVRDGEWIQYFESGKKKSEEVYTNATPNGLWTTWHESTSKKISESTYVDGILEDEFQEWWENGDKKTEGQYLVNKKVGVWMNYDPAGRRSRYELYRFDELVFSYDFEYYANGQIKEEPSFNEDGVRDGKWIQYFESGKKKNEEIYANAKPNGLWTTWHESTFKKVSERTYVDGILEDGFEEWWDNGAKKVKGQYAGNKKEGVWMNYDPGRRLRYELYRSDELVSSYDFEYYDNGQLKEEPSFNIDGQWDGDWIRYFEGGEKASQRGYGNGRPDGIWITWHDSTFVKVQEMTYKDSLLEDKYFEWWMDEKPKVTGFYVHGKKDSKWSYWDKFAHQRFEIYEMDELLFKWGWEYYDNNQVKEEFVYIKTGVLHGEWYAYHKDGSHKGFRGYDNGLRDGAWIDWYTNGQKSFEKKYELDQPVDKWFYWYFFGELMSEVQYENNEIIGQQCFQSSFMYSKPDEELGDCSTIFDLEDFEHGVFRLYSSSKVLIKETFINDNELLAQFEYHDNSEPSTIALFRQGEIIFFKRWNPEGIEIIDDPDPSGLFSSWDYYLNGNVKYKVTYMGIEKKEKHGIEWSYYNDRTWEQINLFYRGELQLSRKWTHGASISVDTLYQDGKKVFAIKPDVQEK